MKNVLPMLLLIALLPTVATAQPVRLDGNESISPHGHFELLLDRDGTLTPETATAATGWQPLASGLQLGFTPQTVWLRTQVRRAADAPPEWVLKLSNALLDDARLYQHEESLLPPALPASPANWRAPAWRDVGKGWHGLIAGEDHDRNDWPIDYRSPVFPLELIGEASTTLLLRLQTKNAMSVSFELMPRDMFDDFSRREAFLYGIYAGFCLLLILFHATFWQMTHAPDSGWYLGYLTSILMTMLLSCGALQQLLRLPVTVSDPLLGVSLILGMLPLGVIFTSRQLHLPRFYPRLQRFLVWGSIVLASFAIAAILAGHYGIGMPPVQMTSLLLIPLYIGLALHLWRNGHQQARFFLMAFGIFYIGVVISFLRNLGLLPATTLTDNATVVGTMLHMSIMSLRIIGHYNQLKRDRTTAQTEAFRATRVLNDRLEQQVTERTAKLRAALDNETRIRAEQREFVAMVSHEFRTPLAIIETSAQQIARNPTTVDKTTRRSRNIREAAARMRTLVEDYLSADRMDEATTLQMTHFRLDQLLLTMVSRWPIERMRISPPARRVPMLSGDLGLLRVALRNLLANADRHAPPASTIELQCEHAAGVLRITVSNHCDSPIPPEEHKHLFQKYYRGRQAQGKPGAGLGLYLVQRIARLHGGDVALLDAGDSGRVTFELTLPIHDTVTTSRHSAEAPLSDARLSESTTG